MLKHSHKQLFYSLAAPVMRINGMIHRHLRRPGGDVVKVQLGPGQDKYLQGWTNVDANMFTGRCDIWADLRHPLPFPDRSVDIFYSHHVIEHLPDLQGHFSELFRCLKPGGVIRVGGPNGDSAIRKFLENDLKWFDEFPDKRQSVGGRFENFIFCRQEHLTILTASYLEEITAKSGFVDFKVRIPVTDTGYPRFIDSQVLGKEWENTPQCPRTLIIEARKPSGAGGTV